MPTSLNGRTILTLRIADPFKVEVEVLSVLVLSSSDIEGSVHSS